MHVPKVPEEFYTGLGKVVVETTALEYHVAFLVTLLNGGGVEELDTTFAAWGKVKAEFKTARTVLPAFTQRLDTLMADVEKVRDERNRVAHSLVIQNWPLPEDEAQEITYVQFHAKNVAIHDLPTAGALEDLRRRIGGLTGRTVLTQRQVADALGRDTIPGDGSTEGMTFG